MAVNQETLILLCLVAFFGTLAVSESITFKPCTGELTKPSTVDIDPCPAQPCVFHKGTNVTTTIKFTPPVTVSNGTLEAYGIVGFIKTKFKLPNPYPCKGHGLKCPLKAGKEYSLAITQYIEEIFPSIQLIAQMDFKLPDGNEYLFCFQFALKIAEWQGVGVIDGFSRANQNSGNWNVSILNATLTCELKKNSGLNQNQNLIFNIIYHAYVLEKISSRQTLNLNNIKMLWCDFIQPCSNSCSYIAYCSG